MRVDSFFLIASLVQSAFCAVAAPVEQRGAVDFVLDDGLSRVVSFQAIADESMATFLCGSIADPNFP
jgi:hypothetical protein